MLVAPEMLQYFVAEAAKIGRFHDLQVQEQEQKVVKRDQNQQLVEQIVEFVVVVWTTVGLVDVQELFVLDVAAHIDKKKELKRKGSIDLWLELRQRYH